MNLNQRRENVRRNLEKIGVYAPRNGEENEEFSEPGFCGVCRFLGLLIAVLFAGAGGYLFCSALQIVLGG